jgi:hypothetical protein
MITLGLGRRGARKRWHGFGALLATIAIALQCFLVQTHVDLAPFDSAPSSAALTVAHNSTPALNAESAGRSSTPCIICQEFALAGAFLHAAPPALVLVLHNLSFAVPVEIARPVILPPAHPWQSRAPPSSL